MKLPFIGWIWRVKGSLTLDPPRSPADAFDKLSPLFEANGTSHQIDGDTLTYTKVNPAAQDKMATFTRGTLRVVEEEGLPKLVYNLTSTALLLCFLAPLLFLALAQATIMLGELEKPATEAEASDKPDNKDEVPQLNQLDIFLGAPAPEKPDEKDKDKKHDKYSPKAAYILAAIFAALYVAGRILEPWLIKSTFRKTLSNTPVLSDAQTSDQMEAQRPG